MNYFKRQRVIEPLRDFRTDNRPLTAKFQEYFEYQRRKKLRGIQSELFISSCPLIYSLRVFGMEPYEFDESGQMIPSEINLIFTIIWLVIGSCIIYNSTSNAIAANAITKQNKPILQITELAKVLLNFMTMVFNFTIVIKSRLNITAVWNKIQDFDESMKDIGYCFSQNIKKYFSWSILIVYFLLWTMINYLGMKAFDESWLNNTTYMILYVVSSGAITKFAGLVFILGYRFHHLNKMALQNIPNSPKWMDEHSTVSIQFIHHLHNKLLLCAEELNNIYSYSILVWIGNLSFHVVCDAYYVADWIFDGNFYWNLIYCLVSWIIVFLFQFFLIALSCDYASNQANALAWIILQWRKRLFNRNSKSEIEMLIEFKTRRLNFTAAGCFDVNLSLITSVASALTTYLVILLQID